MNLNIPGSDNIITSDQFLDFGGNNLPDKIVFIGGGYISFEYYDENRDQLEGQEEEAGETIEATINEVF